MSAPDPNEIEIRPKTPRLLGHAPSRGGPAWRASRRRACPEDWAHVDDGFGFPPTAHPVSRAAHRDPLCPSGSSILVWGGWKLVSLASAPRSATPSPPTVDRGRKSSVFGSFSLSTFPARRRNPPQRQRNMSGVDLSIERVVLVRQSNNRLVGFIRRALGFEGHVDANQYFAFRFRHPEKVSQLVEVGRERRSFESVPVHDASDVAGDVEHFPRHSPMRRTVSSSPRSRGSALSGSPASGFKSREAYFLGHPIGAQFGRARQMSPQSLAGKWPATIGLAPASHRMRRPFPTQNKSFSTILLRGASTIMWRSLRTVRPSELYAHRSERNAQQAVAR